MAYHALNSLKPNEEIWKRFYQAIKPAGYAIDSTRARRPIYQDIPNLKDAKSAYGAIVYSKAPGVIKQLAFVVGEDPFRDGLQALSKRTRLCQCRWNDLVRSGEYVIEVARPMGRRVVKCRGMPQVDVEWHVWHHGMNVSTRNSETKRCP